MKTLGCFEGKSDNLFYFSLGRYALASVLRMLEIKHDDCVLIPEFICRDLLASIYSVKAKVIFYPVKNDLTPKSLPVVNSIKAVIAVNYFGFPQNLGPFYEYCDKYNVVLIEDNAHGLISRDEFGKLLGSRADVGIYSMRKTFPLPDGAALQINSQHLFSFRQEPLACLNTELSKGYHIKKLLRFLQNKFKLPVRSYAELMVRLFRRIKTGNELPIPKHDAEVSIPGKPNISCQSLKLLKYIDVNKETKRRRDAYHLMCNILKGYDIEPIFDKLPEHTVPYGYPFRADEDDAIKVKRKVFKYGFDCAKWPDLPDKIKENIADYHKKVWWVNFIC